MLCQMQGYTSSIESVAQLSKRLRVIRQAVSTLYRGILRIHACLHLLGTIRKFECKFLISALDNWELKYTDGLSLAILFTA